MSLGMLTKLVGRGPLVRAIIHGMIDGFAVYLGVTERTL